MWAPFFKKNPVFYAFAGIGTVLLLFAIFIGVPFWLTLQLLFVPYTYDVTRGVGATGATIYSVVLATAQVALVLLTALGDKLKNTVSRRIVWGVGVVLVVIYFVFMVLGFLINNFH